MAFLAHFCTPVTVLFFALNHFIPRCRLFLSPPDLAEHCLHSSILLRQTSRYKSPVHLLFLFLGLLFRVVSCSSLFAFPSVFSTPKKPAVCCFAPGVHGINLIAPLPRSLFRVCTSSYPFVSCQFLCLEHLRTTDVVFLFSFATLPINVGGFDCSSVFLLHYLVPF